MRLTAKEKKIHKEILATAAQISQEADLKSGLGIKTSGPLSGVSPGLCLQVVHKGKLKVDLQIGKTFRFYDLASLTKILFTVPAFLQLVDEKRITLDTRVSAILQWWPHKAVTLGQVLSHSAGLPWWAPFYKMLNQKKIRPGDEKVRQVVQKYLAGIKLSKEKQSVYSDLDFILLGYVLETLHGGGSATQGSIVANAHTGLLQVWQQLEWVDRTHLHFNLANPKTGRYKLQYKKSLYAPTENCPWRKKILQGEIHDDNTWSFGGVSTHAGLFGTIDDVTCYGQLLRHSYYGLGLSKPKNNSKVGGGMASPSRFASSKTLRQFAKRAIPTKQGDWASGYMMPTRGSASCGRYFHAASIGHTGFTGTSFWFDPHRDLIVSILSNRVHPTRDNRSFLKLRPIIHDIVVENL